MHPLRNRAAASVGASPTPYHKEQRDSDIHVVMVRVNISKFTWQVFVVLRSSGVPRMSPPERRDRTRILHCKTHKCNMVTIVIHDSMKIAHFSLLVRRCACVDQSLALCILRQDDTLFYVQPCWPATTKMKKWKQIRFANYFTHLRESLPSTLFPDIYISLQGLKKVDTLARNQSANLILHLSPGALLDLF